MFQGWRWIVRFNLELVQHSAAGLSDSSNVILFSGFTQLCVSCCGSNSQFLSISPDMTGTLSSAVSNVTTQLSTLGKLLPRWQPSGVTRASVFYEKSDVCQEPQEEKQAGGQAAKLCLNASKTQPRREMSVHQYANRYPQKIMKRSSLGCLLQRTVNSPQLGPCYRDSASPW